MTRGTTRTRIVLLHWLAFLLALGSLATGLRIFSSNYLVREPRWAAWLPTGDVYALHLMLAGAWVFTAMAYGLHRYVHQREQSRTGVVMVLSPGERANDALVRMGRWLLSALLLSGAAAYVLGSAKGDGWVLLCHRYLAFVLPAWILLHGLAQVLVSQWPRVRAILLLQITPRALLQTGILVPLVAGALFWFASATTLSDDATSTTLRVPSIPLEEAMNADGIADEAAWQRAPAVQVQTASVGETGAPVAVRVQALRQGAVIHFLFSWPDSTPSLRHLPLLKTEKGWVVQQQGLAQHDEHVFYEDKLAVLLASHGDAAGDGALQLGRASLAGKPPHATGRGYHSTQSGELVDVWHWKAVRTHDLGQADDSHFGTPYPAVPGEPRYTGGYKSDPDYGGGYSDNWAWFREGVITPKRLPKDPALLEPFQRDWPAGEGPVWGMSWYETQPYDVSLDTYPVGTRMPSVLWMTLFEGDRGDVRAQGHWQAGRWTLEVVRGLEAESAFDLEIRDGIYLWVAPFDHAQTRHNYHLRPMRVSFE